MKDTEKTRRIFMWYKVKELSEKGLNKSQIAQELSIDRKTIRKMLSLSFDEYLGQQKDTRSKLLDPYEPFIFNLLDNFPYMSSSVVEDRLKEHDPALLQVSSKTVYNYVMLVRNRYGIEKVGGDSLRMMKKWADTPYGEWGQVDFGTMLLDTTNGKRQRVHFFVIVLGRSRQKFVFFQNIPFTSRSAVYAHQLSFEYFQGSPAKLLYDQDRVFTKGEKFGDIVLTHEFGRYCEQEVFSPIFCKKADPQTKGKVENVVKYVKHNFLCARSYNTVEQLNREVLGWLERTGNGKVSAGTNLIPNQEWITEKEYLMTPKITPRLPEPEYREYLVRRDHTIKYKGNYYSLPRGTYNKVETHVRVYELSGKLQITTQSGGLLADHVIPTSKGGYVSCSEHWKIPDLSSSELFEQVFQGLGATEEANIWMQILAKKERYLKDNLVAIKHCIDKYDIGIIQRTLEKCIEINVHSAGPFIDIAKTLFSSTPAQIVAAKTSIATLRKIATEPQIRDINSYQNIMSW